MAISAPTAVGSGTNAASSTTVTVAVSTVPPIGSLVVVCARFNTAQSSGSVSDGINTYTTRVQSGNEIVADCIVTGDMTAATITVTGATATAKVAVAFYVTGSDTTARRFGTVVGGVPVFQGTARNIGGLTVTPSNVGDFVLGFWSLDTTETAMAAGANFTIGPTWTGTGYYTANSLSLSFVYQIVTTVAAKEPLGTGGASPFAYGATNAFYRGPAIPELNFATSIA